MKRIIFILTTLLFAFGNSVLGSNNAQGVAELSSTSPSGAGKVYVTCVANGAAQPSDPSDSEYTSPSADKTSDSGNSTKWDFYFYAKANDGYKFVGWSETDGQYDLGNSSPLKRTITSGSSKTGSTTTKIYYAHFIRRTIANLTFEATTNGTYTATDGTTTVTNSGSMTTEDIVTLKATPASGYKVYGWYTKSGDTKTYFAFDSNIAKKFEEDATVGVDFVETETPVFIIKGKTPTYTDLNSAITAAGTSGTIVLVASGTVPAGNYTIPAGVTLLIPYDAAYTEETTEPTRVSTYTKISVYKTLKLAPGANIMVNGAICVGGQQYNAGAVLSGSASSGSPGAVSGAYGCIDMSEGGNITLNNDAKLYAWGYITGQNKDQGNNTSGVGSIDAKSGSTVYEDFVIGSWRGGTATVSMRSNSQKVFPFNQYFLPNIEVPLTLEYGATEIVNTSVTMSGSVYPMNSITFIGSSDGFFTLSSGATLTKWYDATTDYMRVDLNGTCALNSIEVEVSGYTINSASFVLPITNNLDVRVAGGTLSLSKDLCVLPGARIEIGSGATAQVSANLYVYDLDEWDDGYFVCGSSYYYVSYELRPTSHYSRTGYTSTAKLADAKLTVDGLLNISGKLYCTSSGANICSTGGGQVKFTAAPTATATTYQATQSNTTIAYSSISCVAPWLQNADGTHVATAGVSAGTTYYYYDGRWNTSASPWAIGDVNHSTTVSLADVPTLIEVLLGHRSADSYGTANVNNDTELNKDDVDALVDVIMNK